MVNSNNAIRSGFVQALAVSALALVAATTAHMSAAAVGLDATFFEGAAGGAVLAVFVYRMYRRVARASPLVDASSPDRIEYDDPKPATVTVNGEQREEMVFAIETQPGDGHPFKVWVADGSGKERHPYYATAVDIERAAIKSDAGGDT